MSLIGPKRGATVAGILLERLMLAITHKGDALAVGRPRRNIYRALTAINIRNHARLYFIEWHQSNIDVLIKRMVIWVHVFEKREKDDPLAIWRDVRKPVVV